MNQRVKVVGANRGKPSRGSCGLESQCMGVATTVSAAGYATGGINGGNIIATSIG